MYIWRGRAYVCTFGNFVFEAEKAGFYLTVNREKAQQDPRLLRQHVLLTLLFKIIS